MPQSLTSIPSLSAHEPIHDDDEHNDAIHSRDVIHICGTCQRLHDSNINSPMDRSLDDLLPPVTGLAGGNEYMIMVKQVHSSNTTLDKRPKGPNQKGP